MGKRTLGLNLISILLVAKIVEYTLFGMRAYISVHGVQMDNPILKLLPTEYTVFQMTYHKKVSKKNRLRSMTNISASVNLAWFRQSTEPKTRSSHIRISMCAIARIGSRNDVLRKKYDSTNLQMKVIVHMLSEAVRAFPCSTGYDAVNVWLARYLRAFPVTRSPNSRPEGTMKKMRVTTMLMPSWTSAMMSGMLLSVVPSTQTT
jgi:hypothetical protein